jgi:hypothetical protein
MSFILTQGHSLCQVFIPSIDAQIPLMVKFILDLIPIGPNEKTNTYTIIKIQIQKITIAIFIEQFVNLELIILNGILFTNLQTKNIV